MFFKKTTKADELQKNMKMQEKRQNLAIKRFYEMYKNRKAFECIKQLGVLEYLGVEDCAFYEALTYQINEKYEEALCSFEKITKESKVYIDALHGKATIYCEKGDIERLNKILIKAEMPMNPLEKLNAKLLCLANMDLQEYENTIEELRSMQYGIISQEEINSVNSETYFVMCQLLCEALVGACVCVKHCKVHNELFKKDNTKTLGDSDLKTATLLYSKLCYMLSLSTCVESLKFSDPKLNLERCALNHIEWHKKISVIDDISFQRELLRIIVKLLNPEIHSFMDISVNMGCLLSLCMAIHMDSLPEIISHYFEYIKEGYCKGNVNIIETVNYTYAKMLVTKTNPYELKERLETFILMNENIQEKMGEIQLKMMLSPKVFNALETTEKNWKLINQHALGNRDYSSISLQYFRIIEMEINEKLIRPLAESIEPNVLDSLVKKDKNENGHDWSIDSKSLKKIYYKKQESIEIGVARTLLKNIVNWNNDYCAQYLEGKIVPLLTTTGVVAFKNYILTAVLDDSQVTKYRIPGAHTGILPYSVACESRKYLLDKLPDVVSWFKNN